MLTLLNVPEAEGVFNFTAPSPANNRRFSKLLAAALFRPCIFRMPAFLLKLGMGEMSTMLVDGQRVVPQHLLDLHFRFKFEHIDEALNDLLKNTHTHEKLEKGV